MLLSTFCKLFIVYLHSYTNPWSRPLSSIGKHLRNIDRITNICYDANMEGTMTEPKKNNIADEADKIYTNLCKLYGEYFNYVREQKGLSLRELSKQTNISIALISLLENGDKLPRIETLIRLILALGIPFNEILGRKATGLEFSFNPEVTTKRDDELLRNTLLKMGCDKDDVKDILEYIDYKKYRKAVLSKMPKRIADKEI